MCIIFKCKHCVFYFNVLGRKVYRKGIFLDFLQLPNLFLYGFESLNELIL